MSFVGGTNKMKSNCKNKKIELFINSLQSGGAEHQISILANFLSEKGYDVTLTTINKANDHYDLSSSVRRVRVCGKSGLRFLKALKVFVHFQITRCDCLIVFCQRNIYYALRSLSWRMKRPKIICSERNYLSFPGKYEDVIYNKYYPKLVDHIVSNSYSQTKYLTCCLPSLTDKLSTIINYTDLNLFCPQYRIPGKILKILVLARVQKQKNCLRFIQALSLLCSKTSRDFVVDWYGAQQFSNEASNEYVKKVYDLIRVNNLCGVINLHGPTNNICNLINSYDVVCLPSLFEGFSNSIAEGICCGKPMIVSDVSDNRIMVHDNENGFLFDPTDNNSIVDAFIRFFSLNIEEMILMGQRSREIAEALFDKESFINSYINLIEE
jgi:glycosyltransferase involved in cell wall biosynthesis